MTVEGQNGSSKKEALDFLNKHNVGVLATVTKQGEPYATAVYFLIDDSFNVCFVTKSKTQKAQNLENKNLAMLLVYDDQTTVQLAGKVTKITDVLEVNRLYTKIIYMSVGDDWVGLPPQTNIKAGDYVAYSLKPRLARVAAYNKDKDAGYVDILKPSK